MYKILDSPKRMSLEEIENEFKGKWVYLVDVEGPDFGWFKSAVPAVIADEPFEGRKLGIYDKLDDDYKGKTTDLTIPPFTRHVFGFHEVLMDDD